MIEIPERCQKASHEASSSASLHFMLERRNNKIACSSSSTRRRKNSLTQHIFDCGASCGEKLLVKLSAFRPLYSLLSHHTHAHACTHASTQACARAHTRTQTHKHTEVIILWDGRNNSLQSSKSGGQTPASVFFPPKLARNSPVVWPTTLSSLLSLFYLIPLFLS